MSAMINSVPVEIGQIWMCGLSNEHMVFEITEDRILTQAINTDGIVIAGGNCMAYAHDGSYGLGDAFKLKKLITTFKERFVQSGGDYAIAHFAVSCGKSYGLWGKYVFSSNYEILTNLRTGDLTFKYINMVEETDWSKVSVGMPILVSDDGKNWVYRNFAAYLFDRIYTSNMNIRY